jgi:Uma2 family endonuclease
MERLKTKSSQRFRTPSQVIRKKADYLSLEKFISLNLEGKTTKYEWKNGNILVEFKMKKEERVIIDNIITKFIFSDKAKDGSRIMAEADTELPSVKTFRRPDAVYFTRQQIVNPNAEPTVPYFVIEVNSKSNTFDAFEDKLEDYFRAGVQTVWLINPHNLKVYEYHSSKKAEIKTENEICIANLEDNITFEMRVDEIFKDFVALN